MTVQPIFITYHILPWGLVTLVQLTLRANTTVYIYKIFMDYWLGFDSTQKHTLPVVYTVSIIKLEFNQIL